MKERTQEDKFGVSYFDHDEFRSFEGISEEKSHRRVETQLCSSEKHWQCQPLDDSVGRRALSQECERCHLVQQPRSRALSL